MAAREYRKTQKVEETEKRIPLITGKIAFCQQVCELVFGVNTFDLDFGVQIDSVEQPIKRDCVGSGHLSHRRASAFNDHLDLCFIVSKNEKAWLRSEKVLRL